MEGLASETTLIIIGRAGGSPPSRTNSMIFLYIIGRAGASPPSRTNSMIFLYIYLYIYLRASFSPIFQYFSAVNVTRTYVFLFLPYFNIS